MARVIDDSGTWVGADSRLWFVGDFFDRGPDGIGVLELVMRLENEAQETGGFVGALLGNHELFILAAKRFGARGDSEGLEMMRFWQSIGGMDSDLQSLTSEHISWLKHLPALELEHGRLLAHADSLFYLDYGDSVESINAAIHKVLVGEDMDEWLRAMDGFSSRHDFDASRPGGETRAEFFLKLLGANQLIHGHTPIDKVAKSQAKDVHGPLVYADGLCVNVDGGMYRGGPGFIYQLPGASHSTGSSEPN